MSSKRIISTIQGIDVEAVPISDQIDANVRDMMAARTFDIVTGYALTHALFAFANSPLWGHFKKHGFVDVNAAVEEHRLQKRHAYGLMNFMVTQDLFAEEQGEIFHPTPKGLAATSTPSIGWITMIRGGYGPLMENAVALMKGERTYGVDCERDGYSVAMGSSMTTNSLLDDTPYRVLEQRGCKVVADLGCGAGHFLIELAKRNRSILGIGVDLSPEAQVAATARAEAAGVGDRVKFVVGDCFRLDQIKKHLADVDVFYSFGMEHELFRDGEQAVLDHIDHLAEILPGKAYLLGEPMLTMTAIDGDFYWVHVLSHQGIPRNIPGWIDVLKGLKRGKLNRVYTPEHRKRGAYFDIQFNE